MAPGVVLLQAKIGGKASPLSTCMAPCLDVRDRGDQPEALESPRPRYMEENW